MSDNTLREAYDSAADAWGDGPDRVYGALAEALLARGPAWSGLQVLDVGAGSGTATRRLVDAGAAVIPTDMATGMLAVARARCRCRPVAADAMALPLRRDAVDAVIMGFVLNHLPEPAAAMAEAARVVRPGGWVLASTWAREDDHPVRHLVEAALTARGWQSPDWYVELKQQTAMLTDTAAGLAAAARSAGLTSIDAARVDVEVALAAPDLVAWRLGMPHSAPFVAGLAEADRAALRAELTTATTGLPPLVCLAIMLSARVHV
jgi:ubiquinone/menaquinone biosynthesis C-methylase UbiE